MFNLIKVFGDNMRLNGNKMQFGTVELGMSGLAVLTTKQLILIRNAIGLIPQKAEHLIIHLTALQNGPNLLIIQIIQNGVL
jgi:hypothetical protein